MKKVIILMASHTGHYNASYQLSKCLETLGYEITYAGDNKFKESVIGMGFNFKKYNFTETLNDPNHLSFKSFIKNFNQKISYKKNEKFLRFKAQAYLLEDLICLNNPDLILIDSFLFLHSIILYKYKAKIILLETMLSRLKESNIPPLNSDLVHFSSKLLLKSFIKLQWINHSVKMNCRTLVKDIINFNQSYHKLVYRYFSEKGVNLDDILDKNRCFFYNLKGLKEIVLSPAEIDFPYKIHNQNQFHFSAIRDLKRFDNQIDEDYYKFQDHIKLSSRNSKVIYCSLGSIAGIHLNRPGLFLKKVLHAFSNINDRILIISTGDDQLKKSLPNNSKNVFLFNKIPQTDILLYCDLFITHGGLNSIIESILTATPVLVYPLNNRWDQIGNSSRVLFHKIGLRGDIKNDTSTDIREKSELIIKNHEFIYSINKLKSCFRKHETIKDKLNQFIEICE